MPPQKPSPHRFLASPVTPRLKEKSKLRHAVTHAHASTVSADDTASHGGSGNVDMTTALKTQGKSFTPARRFVVTANESVDRNGNVNTRKRAFERVESIEEASQGSLSQLSLYEEDGDLLQMVEGRMSVDEDEEVSTPHHLEREEKDHDVDEEQNEDEEGEEMLFPSHPPPKRKRKRTHSPPSTPAPTTHAPHRFRFPPTKPPDSPFTSTPTTSTSTSHQRPTFLLPPQPTSPPAPSKPLPDLFSPSRKGGRYVPGGLAATVQGWIVEAAARGEVQTQTQTQTQTQMQMQGHPRIGGGEQTRQSVKKDGIGLKLRLRLLGLSTGDGEKPTTTTTTTDTDFTFTPHPGTFLFALATAEPETEPETEAGIEARIGMYNASRAPNRDTRGDEEQQEKHQVRLLLAGQGGGRGPTSGVKVKAGSLIELRAPVWEVDVGGVGWVVGVEWVVL